MDYRLQNISKLYENEPFHFCANYRDPWPTCNSSSWFITRQSPPNSKEDESWSENFFLKNKIKRSKHRNILKWKVLSPLTGLTWEVKIPYKGLGLLILSKLQVGAHQDSTTPIIFILHLCFCIIFPKFDSI